MVKGVLKNIREFMTAFLVVLAGTVVIVSGSVYVLHIGNRITSQYVPLADATMQMRLDITDAHLWLEEILGGDTSEDIQVVWSSLECATRHVDAILEGGEDEDWRYIPVDSPTIRDQAEVVKIRLEELISLTHKRWQVKELAKTGTDIDEEYDSIFRGFIDDAYQLERQLRGVIKSDTLLFKRMQIGFIFGSMLVALAVLLTLYKYMKQRKVSEERNRLTLDNMISGYALHEMIYDDDGKAIDYRFLDANPVFEKLVGMDPAGKTVRQIIPNIDDLWIETFAEITQTGVGKRFEQYQAETGKWWEVAGFRVKPGQFAGTFNDITKRKKAEEELEKLLNSLQAKNKELESIVYTISHDLRSPLVNVTGYCNELERSYAKIERMILAEQLPDELRDKCKNELAGDSLESLEYIINSAMKMDVLLAGLLKVCRLGCQESEIKRLDMNELIDDVVEGMNYQITEMSVDFRRDDLPECMGDKVQINQVFSNLIDNAIKYMAPERACKIIVSAEIKDDMAVYCVQDNGVGINEDYRERIFDIFHRLDPFGEIAGEGLGLTIVRRIVDMHNGSVWFESEEGKGCRVYVSLPRE